MSPMAKLGVFLLILSLFLAFCIITNCLPFIRSFFLGALGVSIYPLLVVCAIIGGLMMSGKKYVVAKNYVFSLIGLYFILLCVCQTIFTDLSVATLGQYISEIYAAKITPGGVVAGFFAYGISALVNFAGALIIFGILALVCVAFMIDYRLKVRDYNKLNARAVTYPIASPAYTEPAAAKPVKTEAKIKHSQKKQKPAERNVGLDVENKKAVLVGAEAESEVSLADKLAQKIFGTDYDTLVNKDKPVEADAPMTLSDYMDSAKENSFANFNKNTQSNTNTSAKSHTTPFFEPSKNEDFFTQKPEFSTAKQQSFVADLKLEPLNSMSSMSSARPSPSPFADISKIIDEVKPTSFNNDFAQNLKPKTREEKLEQLEMSQTKPTTSPTTVYKRPSPYVRPPLNLLTTQSSKLEEHDADFKQNAHILEETLDSFKISATVESIVQGPAVTRYEIKMPVGISVNKIKQHADDIAMMMRSVGGVRIEAPIPGKNLVGIELPNKKIATIGLKDVLDSPEFHNTKSSLPFALGKNIAGSIKICDLSSMPHLLVAGSTGSGKSVCLNIIIIRLIIQNGAGRPKTCFD